MRKRKNTYLKHVFCFFVFLLSLNCLAQDPVFDQPEVGFTGYACASSSHNSFTIDFKFGGAEFNDDNDFIVELSDAEGNFNENTINLATLTDNSLNVNFFGAEGSFSFPEGIAGENYRIQIRGTSPAVTSPATEPFAVYVLPDAGISINNDKNLTLCNGTSAEIDVVLDNDAYNVNDYEYVWFFNNNIINGENGSTLIVDAPGRYKAGFYLGSTCTFTDSSINAQSNAITVSSANIEQIFIEGDNTINLCANETYDLEASVDNTEYTYTWLKDGDVLDSGYIPIYTTDDTNQYGVYQLQVSAGDCVVDSQEVTIQALDGAGFEISIDSAETRIILPTETITLEVEVEPSSSGLTYQWYKDGTTLFNKQSEIQIVSAGEYYVEVTDASSSCAVVLNSDTYTMIEPSSFEPLIRVDNYEECNTESALLTLIGVNALDADDVSYELSSAQIGLLKPQWYKDGALVVDEEDSSLNVVSYVDNGSYYLNVSVGSGIGEKTGDSASENIFLTPNFQINSSSDSNKLCTGSIINLSIDVVAGFDYTWYKDDVAITVDDVSSVNIDEVGDYYVTYEGFDCLNFTDTINIVSFDEDVFELSPSSTAVLAAESTVVLSASGADSYKWFNEDGDLKSSTDTLEIGVLGVYTVTGTVGECEISKEIEVVADDGSFRIPNVLTPFNGDNVNDTWEIPNKYSFQSNVQVIIYNSQGEEKLNTFDYQNDWPNSLDVSGGKIFYFKVIQEENLIKAGTISILE